MLPSSPPTPTPPTPSPHLLYSDLLTSLRVPHAFTTRRGGYSKGIFESLNFGNPGELADRDRDPIATIELNIQLVKDVLDTSGREVVQVHQVHGCSVHPVERGQPSHQTPHSTKADAIITADDHRLLMVRTADCAPILLASDDGRMVAAVHAGWRGVVAGVILQTYELLRAKMHRPIVAAIGPCLSPPHFEVGEDVIEAFKQVFGSQTTHISHPEHGKSQLNMKSALAEQLHACGVSAVDTLPYCTVADRGLFFSHRADKGLTGRMAAFIGPLRGV